MIHEDDLHLAEFCRSAQPRLQALARFLTKGSQVEAEDLTQDTLHVFVQKWKNGMIVADPEKYADGILRKLAKRALQKNSEVRRRQVPLEEAQAPAIPDIANAVEERAKYELLHDSVSVVENPRQRNFLSWSLEGASIPEIADREFKESGRRSSSHQISCALERGRGNVSGHYKRRGGWRVILPPVSWVGSLRRKVDEIGQPLIEMSYSAAFAGCVSAVVGVLMMLPGPGAVQSVAGVEGVEISRVGTTRTVPPTLPPLRSVVQPPGAEAAQLTPIQLGGGQTGLYLKPLPEEESEAPPSGPEDWLNEVISQPVRLPQCGGLPICDAL